MGFRTRLLAVLLLASGCAGPLVLDDDSALVVIPHRIGSHEHIIVQAMINDQGPFRFALDTGASISVVFDSARKRAGLELVPGTQVRVHGMVGSGGFPITTIDHLRVGGESWTNARVASLPANSTVAAEMDGILGVDFLSHYAVGVFAEARVVRLYSPPLVSERSYRGWTSVPMRQFRIGQGDAAAYSIDLRINAATIPALLDLGAGFNVMNWRAARMIRVRPTKPPGRTEISGAVDTVPVIAELQVDELVIKDLYWRNRTFFIAKFPIFEVLDLEDRPVAIVGPGLFRNRDFVIDFTRSRLLVRNSK